LRQFNLHGVASFQIPFSGARCALRIRISCDSCAARNSAYVARSSY
jgi:hypothetical protein